MCYCANCGNQVAPNSVICFNCGCLVNPHNSNFVYNPSRQGSGMGIASMVLGIMSLLTLGLYGLGLILAVVGLILGIVQQGR